MTVFGADPNANILFYYPSVSSVVSSNVGTTNASGYFTTTVNPASYNVAIGASTYVIVDGAQSQAIPWPNYTTQTGSGYISLSQANVSLVVGQGTSVNVSSNISNIGTVSIPGNTNPAIASASVSGNQIVVNGLAAGSTAVTVCAQNAGCTTLNVTVQANTNTTSNTTSSVNAIAFSQNTVSVPVGQTQTVTLSGPGSFYVSANSNISIASTYINSSALTIDGLASGNTALSVCSAGNNITSCATINVTVTLTGSTSNNSTASTSVYVSPTSVNILIGQTMSVSLSASQTGGGSYYVQTNSNPAAATVNVVGTTAQVIGVAYGGTNVSICEIGITNCANLYVYTNPAANGGIVTNTNNSNSIVLPLALTSFSVTSSNANNAFMAGGDGLTMAFTANQTISIPTVTVDGSQIAVYGSGSGPYTALYTMTGSESLPLSVGLSISNSAGATAHQYFSFDNSSTVPSSSTAVPAASSCPANLVCTPSTTASSGSSSSYSGYSFQNYLYIGMTGIGQSNPDVVALQKRLARDGDFTGAATGYFGPRTKAAVEAYQTANGLSPIGVVGPSTRNLLNQGI